MILMSLISLKTKEHFLATIYVFTLSSIFFFPLQNQVKHILNHQDQDKSHTWEQSPQETERLEHSNKPEPTREEVIEATMKELDKMKCLTLGNEGMQSSK